jgi:uncharacterized phage-like protein YoqJ
MDKICCVTGHRKIPVEQTDFVKDELRREILLAVNDGYTRFISGFAAGVDLYFAEIVAGLMREIYGITLEAAVPYRKRLETPDRTFQRLIKLCETVYVASESYSKGSYMTRNMYMVNRSQRVIAVYDGRGSGGTAFTLRRARAANKQLRIITVERPQI